MCGFVGRVNARANVARDELNAMLTRVLHRGPDGTGIYVEGNVGMAHARLAIVDLAAGPQPAVTDDTVLVYNGEIYDHNTLRESLPGPFTTTCDTETLLCAHERHGDETPAELRGMFAYAAWDRRAQRLVLVRDRLGIKPLYYAHLPSGDLLFASELKALLASGDVDRRLDPDAVAAYHVLRYVPAPATILRGIRKLSPGTMLVWQAGGVTMKRWWQVPTVKELHPSTLAEAGGRLCHLLDEVVSMHRLGDVPIGTFLSGGLDSSLVTALLTLASRRDGGPPPRTFAVGYDGKESGRSDERDFARVVAHHLGSTHTEITVTDGDVASALPRIVRDLDEPLGDPAAIPLWFLAQRAACDVKVVLSGEGADEVFGGYGIYRRALWLDAMVRYSGLHHFWEPPTYLGVAAGFGRVHDVPDLARLPWQRAISAPTLLSRMLAFDQQVWLPDDLLLKADRMTMAHGLELRVPLLDHRLLEEANGWPDEWKVSHAEGKRILRRAALGLLPREILERKKMGFSTPTAVWLRGALRPWAESCFSDAPTRRLWRAHQAGRDHSATLWTRLSLELWKTHVLSRG